MLLQNRQKADLLSFRVMGKMSVKNNTTKRPLIPYLLAQILHFPKKNTLIVPFLSRFLGGFHLPKPTPPGPSLQPVAQQRRFSHGAAPSGAAGVATGAAAGVAAPDQVDRGRSLGVKPGNRPRRMRKNNGFKP